MKRLNKITTTLVIVLLSCAAKVSAAPSQKILSVNLQKVFENYDEAKASQAAFSESIAVAQEEFKEMYEAATKLQEEIAELNEKAENTALLDSAREKFRGEAAGKVDVLRAKEKELFQFRQDINKKLTDRRNKELAEHSKTIEDVIAKIAKEKKADVVLNKFIGTLYVDESLDITQLVVDRLNSKH
jgi:Skp family chaperone for outer membrane proteins